MLLDRARAKNRLIHPLLRQWADHLMQEVRAQRLREDVVKLPAPRNRYSAPEAMTQAAAMLIQELHQPSWERDGNPIYLTNGLGCTRQDKFRPQRYDQIVTD